MAIAVWNVRLPRILLACLVGCGLSAAGTAYQTVFQNPMAAPDILGASSGACFGAALAILTGQSTVMVTVLPSWPACCPWPWSIWWAADPGAAVW